MKITMNVTGTEVAIIDDLVKPSPVAVVLKVRRVLLLSQKL